MNCGNCKYWTPFHGCRDRAPGFGLCSAISTHENSFIRDEKRWSTDETDPNVEACVEDLSGCGIFRTRETFYCKLHVVR
jgi:hypothetical protein